MKGSHATRGVAGAPLIWTVAAELLPASIRAPAMSVATLFFWSTSFLVAQLTLSLIEALSAPGAFALFAIGAAAAAAFVACVLPETKDALQPELGASSSLLALPHQSDAPPARMRHPPRSPARRPGLGSPLKLQRTDSEDSTADEWQQIADGRVAVEWAREVRGTGSEQGSSTGSSPLGML